MTKPPLDDIRVGKALNLGFDREAMVGTIFSKDVIPATQLIVPAFPATIPTSRSGGTIRTRRCGLLDEAPADGVPVDEGS